MTSLLCLYKKFSGETQPCNIISWFFFFNYRWRDILDGIPFISLAKIVLKISRKFFRDTVRNSFKHVSGFMKTYFEFLSMDFFTNIPRYSSRNTFRNSRQNYHWNFFGSFSRNLSNESSSNWCTGFLRNPFGKSSWVSLRDFTGNSFKRCYMNSC